MLEPNVEKKIKNFDIKLEKYLPLSIFDSVKGFIPSTMVGAAPAAILSIRDQSGRIITKSWICSGSFLIRPVYIGLNDNYYLIMMEPEPKLFTSLIEVIDKKGRIKKVEIEVNKPYSISGWKLYQVNYDTRMGRFSKISILDAVKDPWLPLVYIGIFLLMIGSIYLFWIGNSQIKTSVEINN